MKYWSILEKLCMALESFQKLQTMLEGEHYVKASLLIPIISDRRDVFLFEATGRCRGVAA